MAENEANGNGAEIQYHAPVESQDATVEGGEENQDYIISAIGTGKKCLNKYQIVIPVPNIAQLIADGATIEDLATWFSDERDTDLQGVINTCARSWSTRPNFPEFVDKDAEPVETPDPAKPNNPYIDFPLKEDGHNSMQVLMTGYSVGQTREKKSKVTRAQLDASEARAKASDQTVLDLQEELARMKEQYGVD